MTTLPPYAQDGNIPQKRCSLCKKLKPATPDYFHKDMDGLRCECKACRSTSKQPVLPEGYKLCTGPCGRMLTATTEFFYRCKTGKYGLTSCCKECTGKVYPKERISRKEKLCTGSCGRTLPATSEYFSIRNASPDGLSHQCKQCIDGYQRTPETYEHIRAQRKEYASRPEVFARMLAHNRNRRARKKSVPGVHTTAQIQNLLKRQKHRCYYCGVKFEKRKGKYIYQIDHTFPLSRVIETDIPANDISYLVLACPPCNLSKNDRFPWEWPRGGRLL